jgi:hypothetical protein
MEEVGEGFSSTLTLFLWVTPFPQPLSPSSIVERRTGCHDHAATSGGKLRDERLYQQGAGWAATGLNYFYVPSRDGGTGRRSGLKIRRGQPRGGSTPPPGTT